MMVTRGWGMGNGELVFNGCRGSVLEDEEFWRWTVVMFVQNEHVLNAIELYT